MFIFSLSHFINNFHTQKKKRLLPWKQLCKPNASVQACIYFAFILFCPLHSMSNISVWVSVLLCRNKDRLIKVPHFWLMGMSVNWRRQALQIELRCSIVCTLVWFLMHQSHKMSLFKDEEKTFNYKMAGKLHWHIYMKTKIHYEQKHTTCNIKPFWDRMSHGLSLAM